MWGRRPRRARPMRLISAVCSGSGLVCLRRTSESDVARAASLRDALVETINGLQRDFFLESALVAGGKTSLDANLRDPVPRRAFPPSSAAVTLPALTSSNALALMHHFGVARGSAREARSCAASTDAMAVFVAAALGRDVKLFSTSGVPTSAPAVKLAPVTVVDVAEGNKIVVCHHVAFPSALYYCHRVTGTKVVQATLQSEGYGSTPITGVWPFASSTPRSGSLVTRLSKR